MKLKPKAFHNTFSNLLSSKLKPLVNHNLTLNLATCLEVYTKIFDTLAEIIIEAQLPLSNESMNYIAQQYYDGILINGTQELDPEIFSPRARLELIETKELALMAVMLNGTDFSLPILAEIKKRS